ncbi:MAG: hypothetical protein JGK31_18910 [Microcoleus sp. PH2017_30_WIL_O_A]|uniref:hypothetical protein n=1 Tax=Microcoleus sp. PH2017_16_JOR_D_A TaxID=2798827 RepID=UPI001DFFC6DB|nr:hypothetical protein [Microcoleus sp. PH2017_16_JOR_D_A]MCC3508536.1 hypothetical protein [Microcoleus sp. PH2017_17_BER_D_A]MCC3546810.1 hypothetical protein [Microcoleus sp. PH2017_24_DOB_U_A]MCC3586094.1 hypothetical protein [Microcoleus sp. PH2017_30_WIL_O_A]
MKGAIRRRQIGCDASHFLMIERSPFNLKITTRRSPLHPNLSKSAIAHLPPLYL